MSSARSIKTLGLAGLMAVMAMMVVAAVGAGTAMASVTLHEGSATGTEVPIGESFHATSTNLVFSTSSGNLECKTSEVSGTVTNNKAEPAEGEITAGTFTGEEASPANSCKTTIVVSGVKLNAVITELTGLPWFFWFYANGETRIFSLTEPPTPPVVDFTVKFYRSGVDILECEYTKATLFNEIVAFGAAFEDRISGQKFTSTSTGCPTEGFLNGTFNSIKTDKGVVIYITKP